MQCRGGPSVPTTGPLGGLVLGEQRRFAQLQGTEDLERSWRGLGAPDGAAGGSGELAQVHALERASDVAPRVAHCLLDHAIQHERHEAQRDARSATTPDGR